MSAPGGLRVQLWSYNYDPEPMGIGPVSTVLARELARLGHDVDVVAAHPHYPEPRWGKRLLPYREVRDGLPVLRLPLIIGRATSAQRYRQELSFMLSQAFASPLLGRPDVLISASPSFPSLLPAMLSARIRRVPWIIWLHDILPDGAAATGLIDEGAALRAARRLESSAYRAARRIAVLSRPFVDNLVAKGVPPEKIELIYDPATRRPRSDPPQRDAEGGMRILSMGNIGHSQGLEELVRAFERSQLPADTRLTITGSGVAARDVRAEIRTPRIEMPGVVDDERLETELHRATIGFVSQRYDGAEFNIPSKLMNFMAYGLPVIAAVNPRSEVARLVREAGAGWVVDSSDPAAFPREVERLRGAVGEIQESAVAAAEFAEKHFSQHRFGQHFDELLRAAAADGVGSRR